VTLSIALLTYSTKVRGGVVHTLALAEALAAAGQRVDVWALGRGGDTTFFRPVDPAVGQRIVPVPDVEEESFGARVRRSIDTLRAAFSNHYDVVHAQDCITANAVDRCIRTVHHLDQFTTPELVACHERAIVTPYAHVCVSSAVARELSDGWGITATVIANGVDAARFAAAAGSAPAAVAARQRWRARLGRFVLAVGGIEPRKGSLELLEAYSRLGDPDLRLVIAGGETLFDYRDYRTSFLARAEALGVAPVVLGPVAHDDLPALVASADVFAFPSTKEGFGLAAMEALAAGVPVVASELPVLREVFGDAAHFGTGVDGLVAALRRALARPDPQRRATGQALAAGHLWSTAAQQHLTLYRRQLG
jgi:glycosyltransferase-like protein